MGEPLYRVSTGNYEYRLVLRCRQEARARFAKMRKDVLEKIELLDQKHGLFLLFFTFSYSLLCPPWPVNRCWGFSSFNMLLLFSFFLVSSSGHRVPAAALRVGNVTLLQWLLRRPEGGRCVPHRGGPLPHNDQLQQPAVLLHRRRRGGRGRRRGRRKQCWQTSRKRSGEADRWRMRKPACVCVYHQLHLMSTYSAGSDPGSRKQLQERLTLFTQRGILIRNAAMILYVGVFTVVSVDC